jgi:threonylcarbamoyladenosine tRNA methylthiotransferase MtaB
VACFYIENFGCRATQADGAALEQQFRDKGFERASSSDRAEIIILNTCTVTAEADKDARASIRRHQRLNPQSRILVTGCYAQRAPAELAELPGVTWVVGNSHKHLAAEIATSSLSGNPLFSGADGASNVPSTSGFVPLAELSREYAPYVVVGDIFAHTELLAAPVFEAPNERTRPNLKIQDGCNNRCSFCVIPYVRGQSRSLPMEHVLREIQTLVASGYREVVISGINLGRWGRDLQVVGRRYLDVSEQNTASLNSKLPVLKNPSFVDLIHAILEQTPLEKLRISSVEPMDWTDELINLVASSERIAKHAHVPMQSGSDTVLRRMHRKYRPWHYREKILKIRNAMPTAAIGADVMVGFPGETEAEFLETRRMIEELPLTYLHVFTYSARPGTPASEHTGQVPAPVARERNRILREIASSKKAVFMRSLVGSSVSAITLHSGEAEFTEALTDNYLKMKIYGCHSSNRWMNVKVMNPKVEALNGDTLLGTATDADLGSDLGVHSDEQTH